MADSIWASENNSDKQDWELTQIITMNSSNSQIYLARFKTPVEKL